LKGSVDRIHRLKSEEMWHFYSGGRMAIVLFHENEIEQIIMSSDALIDCQQFKIPANTWFGAYPLPGTDYSFVGCTVSPGFDFQDLEIADRNELLARYPEEHSHHLILKLTTQ
jgi:uncharacterized protein